jgi:hypothetical protein
MTPKPLSVLLTVALCLVAQAQQSRPPSPRTRTAATAPVSIDGIQNCSYYRFIQILDSLPGTFPEICLAHEGETITWNRGDKPFTVTFKSNHHPFKTKYVYSESDSTSDKIVKHNNHSYYKYTIFLSDSGTTLDPQVIIMK